MSNQKRIEDYGINIGELPKGQLNKITDVKGVTVGHCTIDTYENKTGVTVILPVEGNIYTNKLIAASHILNGYGKSTGLMQIDEIGTLESIITLTNTLNVGLVYDAITEYAVEKCTEENIYLSTFNPLICECNDSYLNDIQKRVVGKEHVYKAIENATVDFEEGDIGAGKGMSCHQLKGGIGSASRIVTLDGVPYTIGVLVLSNHGLLKDLTIEGKNIGKKLSSQINVDENIDKGSIISIIATDIPLSSRQLRRICKRAVVGLSKVGSYMGHGSGEIIVGFSTGNVLKHGQNLDILNMRILSEERIDNVFRAVAECEEEAILNSMITANKVIGIKGRSREALKDYFKKGLCQI
ncbi:P1 family peptidase [Schnuerera sp. xch1]|uniref:P1 family peptidase n=1 Tax=Schnuerera sp. xch1 TaxID=2874283 RepID=UPI001CC0BD66|nr:P1 family peptidase [Schnuerera sp. xch1]MBZ2174967.1 P1 family peptidase [Schnuerera sp. xch1]